MGVIGMSETQPRFDGFGIAMLGLAAMLCTGFVLVGSIRVPPAPDDNSVQHSMAIAAWAMVWVSVIGGGIGAASLYLIYRTLLEARRSASAAEDAVRTTERIGQAQVRAYVSIRKVTLNAPEDQTSELISLELLNSGQSPALHITAQVKLELVEIYVDAENYFEKTSLVISDDLPATTDTVITAALMFFKVPGPMLISLRRGPERNLIKVTVDLSYRTVFGETMTESARFYRGIKEEEKLLNSFENMELLRG
jgi:hypothetical protein